MRSSTEDDAKERWAMAVAIVPREVRVEDEGEPMLGHTSEVEKMLIYDN